MRYYSKSVSWRASLLFLFFKQLNFIKHISFSSFFPPLAQHALALAGVPTRAALAIFSCLWELFWLWQHTLSMTALPIGAALILAACLCYGCIPMGVVITLRAYRWTCHGLYFLLMGATLALTACLSHGSLTHGCCIELSCVAWPWLLSHGGLSWPWGHVYRLPMALAVSPQVLGYLPIWWLFSKRGVFFSRGLFLEGGCLGRPIFLGLGNVPTRATLTIGPCL